MNNKSHEIKILVSKSKYLWIIRILILISTAGEDILSAKILF